MCSRSLHPPGCRSPATSRDGRVAGACGGARAVRLAALLGLAALLAAAGGEAPRIGSPGEPPPATPAETVVELQPFRRSETASIEDGAGRTGRATLIDLDPAIHAWLLLRLDWQGPGATETYPLENPEPAHQRVRLAPGPAATLVLERAGRREPCSPWSASASDGFARARRSGAPYAPLCGERLYLRQASRGHRTAKEWAADVLRDHVWGGERITDLVRDTFFRDAWLQTPSLTSNGAAVPEPPAAPAPARIVPADTDKRLDPVDLGLAIAREKDGRIRMGRWYPVVDNPGVFVGAVTPGSVSREGRRQSKHPVNALDPVESAALVYLVAFDLSRFELGFALGTEHPRVDWSDRVLPEMRDPALAGPDGIGTVAPLVRTGMLSPVEQGRAAATFTGGFKRMHGAFRWGPLARVHHGSHYGFIEEGVVLSRLQPGLATVTADRRGRVELRTWREADDGELESIRYARQNGVALVEPDPESGRPGPGVFVTRWGAGNWSGSEDAHLRTLRAGLCLLEQGGRRFLAYGYFSSATPSAMATVFLGYGCRYAMLLDMNALEHTYLALYHRRDGKLLVQHLIEGMDVLDQRRGGTYLPRFVAFPDNRDFFFLLRRPGS